MPVGVLKDIEVLCAEDDEAQKAVPAPSMAKLPCQGEQLPQARPSDDKSDAQF